MIRVAVLAFVLIGAGACAAPVRNVELATLDTNVGYRFHTVDHGLRNDTLVVMTMSGGGTRAAALATGALRGLHHAQFADGTTLDTEIDMLSSVSGGSVTAAYFARYRHAGLAALEQQFLRQDVIGDLVSAGLNPLNLARLPTPSYARIDWLIAAFHKRLFAEGETYATLLNTAGSQPYLIVNAGDVTAEAVFPFTQDRFDLICSDLLDMDLADAVAASAAFPLALTAITLTNYSPCAAQDRAWPDHPPLRIINPLSTSAYDNPQDRRRAAREWAYLNRAYPDDYLGSDGSIDQSRPPRRKAWLRARPVGEGRRYIHLLDGGIADNLGLSEPLYLLSSANSPALTRGRDGNLKNLVQAICEKDIGTILFVVVNARSDRQSALDGRAAAPGLIAMLTGTTSSAIDGSTFGVLDRLDTVTKELLRTNQACDPHAVDDLVVLKVPVDFDFIDDPLCRQRFQDMATTWSLPDREIDALLAAGTALVAKGLGAAPGDGSQPSALLRLGLTLGISQTVRDACEVAKAG